MNLMKVFYLFLAFTPFCFAVYWQKENSTLVNAVDKAINKMFSNDVTTTNIMLPERLKSFKVMDFKNDLLSRFLNITKIIFRQESSEKFVTLTKRRRRFTVFIIDTYVGFVEIYDKISSNRFWFNGFYLFVLINGDIPEIQKIFELLWKLQIYNVNVMFEDENCEIFVKTFMPFSYENCNDTSPALIKAFKDGKFLDDFQKFFPDKMRNLHNCPLRCAISDDSRPSVLVTRFPDGSYQYGGRDIKLINTLAEDLNFKISYTFVGEEGYFFENGTAEGPLKSLLDRRADISVSDWWLKENRLRFFDSPSSYISDQIIFIIPPG